MEPTALAIGPSNYAGQATAWVRAVQAHLELPAWSFTGVPMRGGGFGFEVDKRIGRIAFRNPLLWEMRTRSLLTGASHVALDGFKSFHRWDRHASFGADAVRIAEMGHKVALIAHGSDVRSPDGHLARDEWSYFSVGTDEWRANLRHQTEENRAVAESSGFPVFYSTPDLGADLPFGTWLPVVVDVDAWASSAPVLERERPLVVHVPSQRTPPIKGTHLILPVLQQLHDEGAIELVAPSALPHDQLRELVRTCDILVDQLLFGSYGVAAVEAMAAGRLTIGRMNDDTRARMEEAPNMLEATPETLREVVLSVRGRREELRSAAARGALFARRWHDGRESARVLTGFLEM